MRRAARWVWEWLVWLGGAAWALWSSDGFRTIVMFVGLALACYGVLGNRSLQHTRDADRVNAGEQRCALIRHILFVTDAAGTPDSFTLLLRSDLRACEQTLARYRKQAP